MNGAGSGAESFFRQENGNQWKSICTNLTFSTYESARFKLINVDSLSFFSISLKPWQNELGKMPVAKEGLSFCQHNNKCMPYLILTAIVSNCTNDYALMKIVPTCLYNIFGYFLDNRAKIEWYRNENRNKTCQNNHFLCRRKKSKQLMTYFTPDLLYT